MAGGRQGFVVAPAPAPSVDGRVAEPVGQEAGVLGDGVEVRGAAVGRGDAVGRVGVAVAGGARGEGARPLGGGGLGGVGAGAGAALLGGV